MTALQAEASGPFDRSVLRWLILAAGVAAVLYAFKYRQPATTSDFTIFYQSAAGPPEQMYGSTRVNLNPPHFQLLLEPLTWLPMPVAAEVWRAASVVSLALCLWWLARESREKWTVADVGAALAWAPFYHVMTLNQLTWILWPLLIWAWSAWRQDKWISGSIAFGLALSFKSFLGVFLIWLALRRQWRALAVTLATAAAALAVGIIAYGPDVFVAWISAMRGVKWSAAWTNASLLALLLRTLTNNSSAATPVVLIPALVYPLFLVGAATIVAVTCVRMRDRSVDESWPPLAASALLASPLGWLYYAWWFLPGAKPSRLMVRSPLLWVPMVFLTRGQPSAAATLTFASIYVWGLLIAWLGFVFGATEGAPAGVKNSDTIQIVSIPQK
jgi:alpha-1,2-mannosyltransferase